MKKTLSLLFAALLILLSGCNSVSNGTDITGIDINGCSTGEFEQYYCSTVEEYDQFIEKWNTESKSFRTWRKLPDNFVYWENVPLIGDFAYFYQYSNFPDSYGYDIVDKNRNFIYFNVSHVADSFTSKLEIATGAITTSMTSMAHNPNIPVDTNIFTVTLIERNGIEYYYDSLGYLSFILWEIDGVEFKLSGDFLAGQYKVPEGCFDFYRLFSMDEAEASAAFEEIKQLLSAK